MSLVKAKRSPTTQSINDSTTTTVVFSSDSATGYFDTLGEYDTSTGIFTAASAGYYAVTTGIDWASNATGRREALIYNSNLGGYQGVAKEDASGTFGNILQASTLVYLGAGQTIKIDVWQNSGGALSVQAGEDTFLAIHRVR